MKSKSKKKIANKNKKSLAGFTLVELLGTLAVLAVVITIVIYSVIGIVKNSKMKSYQVTINNVQEVASNYVLEDLALMSWVDEGSYQYQCVTVQNLIDAGYFKGDVLESQVDEDLPLQASDQVYLERDGTTKSVTKSILLVGDRATYTGLCGYINKSGHIRITANPNGWSKQKELTVYYRVYQGNVSDHKYEYSYILNDGSVDGSNVGIFNNSAIYKKYTIDNAGTMYAKIKDLEGNEIATESLSITRIDNTDPSATLSSTNNVAASQTVTLSMSDGGSGVKSYYFGKTNPQTNDVDWIDLSLGVATGETTVSVGKSSYSTTKMVDESGKYYLAVKDLVGNTTVVSKEFYKTTLSISNATVTPSHVITMSGNQFTLPTATANTHYTFGGWYSDSSYSGSKVTTYKPTGNATLYGKVTINTYIITLNNNGATTAGTDKIYEKHGVGIYLDSANAKLMSTSANKINVPAKTGYVFGGYYNGNTQVISSTGYLVSGITNKTFTGNTTLTAKWTANVYTISYMCDGTELTSQKQQITYGTAYTIKGNVCSKTGHSFAGWYDPTNVSWSNSDGTGKSGTWGLVAGQSGITNDNKLTLTAKFTANTYTITLNNNGATTAGTSKIYEKYGTGIYLESSLTNKMSTSSNKITIPTKTDYEFGGYYNGNTQVISSTGYLVSGITSTTFTANTTLTAKWTEIDTVYTITLNSNGADSVGTAKIYEKYNHGVYLDSANTKLMSTSSNKITIPTRKGYVFNGYYTGVATGGGSVQLIDSNGYITSSFTNKYFSSDATLTASWTAIKYTIKYMCNGSELSAQRQTVYYGNTYNIKGSICSKLGYNFDGWYDPTNVSWSNSDGTGMSGTWNYTSGQYGITTDNVLTLTAKFSLPMYTITLDNDDATTAGTEKIYLRYGEGIYLDTAAAKVMSTSANKITIPTKTGYTFLGYYVTKIVTATSTTEEETVQLINSKGYITSEFTNTYFSGNATIYASWSAEHKHKFHASGVRIRSLGGDYPFTCGFDHNKAYARYCTICQMSARYYRDKVYKSFSNGTMWCPCNPLGNSGIDFALDDSGVSNLSEHGGIANGSNMLKVLDKSEIPSNCNRH